MDFADFLAFVRVYGQKVGQETVQTKVALPTGTALKVEELKIVTPVTSVSPAASGEVSVATTTLEKPQVVLVENAKGNPVLLGYVIPTQTGEKPAVGPLAKLTAGGTVEISPTTTALALAMMNPLLGPSSGEQRKQIATKVMEHNDFAGLVSRVESRLRSNPDNVLDGTGSEALYEAAVTILTDVLSAGAPAEKDVKTASSEDPWIADPDSSDGNNIVFVNPNYVYYGVGVSDQGSAAYRATVLLMTREALFELLRWPPIRFYDEYRSDPMSLPDGSYTVFMTKGGIYPFARITDLRDPVGQATLLNFVQMAYNILDIVLSCPKIGIGDLATNLGSLKLELGDDRRLGQ